MSIDLLDTPLRVTWDLHRQEGDCLDRTDSLTVAERLVRAGVFFITLEEQPLLHPHIHELLAVLADGGCQVDLILTGRARELEVLGPELPLRSLFLDVAPLLTEHPQSPLGPLAERVDALRERGWQPSLLMVPTGENLQYLPELLEFCRQREMPRFKLPNFKISANSTGCPDSPPLAPADLERLAEALPDRNGEQPAVEIHDLFLWELIAPGGGGARTEYGGCQAANSLAHIDVEGRLHPCSSWPQPLGSLLERSLEDLWQQSQRFSVRHQIAAVPEGCQGCRDYRICFGGCRGLARCFPETLGRDPLCSGKR